ncbi:MAG: hypothetical protein JWO83_1539 [Caulobacteraceae bacterium]|nr:hypothetical protein [Caulobacteraceae bacterium]
MDGIVNGIGVGFILVLFYGIAGWIKPFWLIKRRWHGAATVVASIMGFGVVNDVPPSRPADITPAAWIQRVGVCREANMDRACPLTSTSVNEATAKVKADNAAALAAASAASSTAGAQPEVAIRPDPAAQAASFMRTQTALSHMVRPCDNAMLKASNTKGVYGSYAAATQAEAACKITMMALFDLKFQEPVSSEARAELNPALNCFAFAYGERRSTMEAAAKLMDGDQRPSKVNAFRGLYKDALARTQECAVQYAKAAVKYGFRDEVAKMARS